jgi:cytochrome c peroxidase
MSGLVERSLRNKLASRRKTIAAVLVSVLVGGWLITSAIGEDSEGNFRSGGIFRIFRDDDGWVQSLPNFSSLNGSNIDGTNTFFKTSFGTNGQSCATCHQPRDGFTIHVSCGPDLPNCLSINSAFDATHGLDPLFRPNDTANRPDADVSTEDARRNAYSLTLALGVTRIGEVLPLPSPAGTAEFAVAPQNTDQFGPLPNSNDPQHPGVQTLSLFRRPLVPNMRFDSAVLWDGRASITNIRGQVTGAAKTLLLNPNPAPADADDVANFMLGVLTDQVIDDRASFPPSHAGSTSAEDARSGTRNMRRTAFSATAPCLFDATGARTHTVTPLVTYYPADGPGTLTPSTCRPVVQGGPNMTDFRPWLEFQEVAHLSDRTFSRASIARGEEIFNRAVLHVPSDVVIPGLQGNTAHCTTCHATNNIGNHPDASFFVRIGSDSVTILQELADAHPEEPSLEDFVTRTKMLPQYCLRSVAAGAPTLDQVACGHYEGDSNNGIPGDVITSDPGRAMISGKWADIGRFKPPTLRGLAPRSPYFHGSAADSTVGIVDFYNARFNIGLSEQQKEDLVRFLEAH